MSRFPDPTMSRAVLIGVSRYHSGDLRDIPAVRANLTDLKSALVGTTSGTVAPEYCTVVSEPGAASDVEHAIATAAAEATDLLLVYYSGHGLVDEHGSLHLALSTTDPRHMRWTALSFDFLHQEIAASRATTRVLVLDCCFSGRAIEAMSDTQGVVIAQVDIAGTYTLTSTTANALSHAPTGATHTAFTGAMLAVLNTPSPLTVDELFRRVDHDLAAQGLPRPQRSTVDTAGDLALFKGSVTTAPPPPTRLRSSFTARLIEDDDLHISALRNRSVPVGLQARIAADRAQTLRDAGDPAAALVVDQRNLARCRARLGDYHPRSLAARLAVGVDLAALSRHEEALASDEATLRDARLVLGEDHPDTLMAAMHVAAGYAALGRTDEALRLGQETLERYRRVFGDDHPATRLCAENLERTT